MAAVPVSAVVSRDDLLPKLLGRAGDDTFVSSDWVGNHFDLFDDGFARRDVGPIQNFEALLRRSRGATSERWSNASSCG